MAELYRDGFVEEELHWWNIPGVEIGAVAVDDQDNAHTLMCRGYGLRDVEKNLPMTGETLGGIASCSKAFTSAVVASLVDEGVLDFDRTVREYLPDFALMDPFASKECTLRDMLYHRTGIAGHDAMWPNPGWSKDDFIRRVRYLQPNRPFRSISQYSNTIYDLIGFIAEKVSGKSYEALVQERIFEPLHMTRSNLFLKATQADEDWAAGYFAEEIGQPWNAEAGRKRPAAEYQLRRMEGWDMNDIGNPAAGVNSCAADMLHWVTLHLSNGVFEGRRLFSENVMNQMHEAAVRMSAFPWRFEEVPGYGFYGMAWKTAIYRGMTLTYHCGEIEGYSSITMFLPGHHFGMFVLCNRHTMCTPFLLELVYTAIDAFLGYPDVNTAFVDRASSAAECHPAVKQHSGVEHQAACGQSADAEPGSAAAGARYLSRKTLQALHGTEPVSWAERLHPYAHDFTGSCADWTMNLMPAAGRRSSGENAPSGTSKPEGHRYAAFAGTYENKAYGPLQITYGAPDGPIGVSYMMDGRDPSPVSLYLHFKQWILPLEPRPDLGENVYGIRNLKEDTLFYTTPLVFTEQDGAPGFTLKLEKEVPAAFFRRTAQEA